MDVYGKWDHSLKHEFPNEVYFQGSFLWFTLSSFSFTKALSHDAFEFKMHFHGDVTRNINFGQTGF